MLAMPGRPVVLDTTALVADVCGAINHHTGSRLLAALESGMVLGYAAEHVWAEVPRKLHTIGDEGRVDGAAAAELWWSRYVPVLRFVDTDTLVAPSEALQLVTEDRTDVPTAKLAALIAPIPVLAADRDLIRHGFAHPQWKATVAAGADAELVHRQICGSAYGTWLVGRAAVAGAKGVSRQMARSGIVGLVAATTVIATIAMLALMVTEDPQRSRTLGRKVAKVAKVAKELAVELGARQADATRRWDETLTGAADASLEARAARVLARASEPLTRTRVARALLPTGTETEIRQLVARLGSVLSDRPAYLQLPQSRWALGRQNMVFR